MSFFSYMKTGNFWKQILFMLLIVTALVTLALLSLNLFTHHGKEVRVADIRGLRPDQLVPYTEQFGFEFVVRDSVYQAGVRPGTILSQSPLPGSVVKRKRTFYLVLAAGSPSSVQMPELADLSLRQAEALLETYGLKVGNVVEVSSVVKGAVIRQLCQGEAIPAGSSIRRGSVVDLEIGNGRGEWSPALDSTGSVLQEEDRDGQEETYGEEVFGEPDSEEYGD